MTSLPRDAEFYLSHAGYVRALARQVVFDAHSAEDIAQETWLAALERPPRDARSPRGWLKSLVRGLASKAWLSRERREQREQTRFDAQGSPPTPDELVEHESARRRIFDALLALDEPYRSALWLRYYDELPPREIAARLSLPVETVRTHLKRGLERLRARLRRDAGAVWSVALVRALRLEPLSYRAAARAAIRTLLQGMVVVSVAQKVLVASAAIAVVAGSLWFFGHSRAIAPQAASVAPAPTELGAVAVETEGASAATPARSAVEIPPPSASQAPSTQTSSTSLLLHVVWADDKTPAPHVGLKLYQSSAEDYYQDVLLVRSGDDGSVLIDPILAGRQSIYFDRGGFADALVERGQRTEKTIEIPLGFDLEGHVRDTDGRALAGADIYVYQCMGDSYEGDVLAHSAADGSYSARSVGAGGLSFVSARAAGRAPTKQKLVLSVAGAKVKVDIAFENAGGALEGRVFALDGTPCAGATVIVGADDGNARVSFDDGSEGRNPAVQRAFTDARGCYRFSGVADGAQILQARTKGLAAWRGEVNVVAGRTSSLDITLVPGAKLAGVVRDEDGAPVAKAHVSVGGHDFGSSFRTARADGTYSFDCVPLGEFEAAAETDQKGSTKTTLFGASGATLRWDPVLSRGLVLRGRVEAPGREIAKWWLSIQATDGSLFMGSAQSDKDGRFEVIGCPDAPLRIEAHAPGGGSWPNAILEDVRASAGELVVRPDPALEPSVHIRGRVLDPDGHPLGGVQVIPGKQGMGHSPILASDVSTGVFEFGPYPPGDWQVRIKQAGFADMVSERHDVQPGETWNLGDVVLQRGGTVVATLRREEGVEENPKYLMLIASDGKREWLFVDGDAAHSGPLLAGRYTLSIGDEGIALDSQELDVRAGEETPIEVVLRAGVAAKVRFVDANGRALGSNLLCEIRDARGFVHDLRVRSKDGASEWSGQLSSGSYHFAAHDEHGHSGALDVTIDASAAPVELTLRIP